MVVDTRLRGRLIAFGSFEVDLPAGELRKAGKRLKLTGQPFQILSILLEHAGEVVTREQLQNRLWPDTFVDVDHNLNTAVNKIREVLGDSAESPRFVETIPRRGYRFIGEIREQPVVATPLSSEVSLAKWKKWAIGIVTLGIAGLVFLTVVARVRPALERPPRVLGYSQLTNDALPKGDPEFPLVDPAGLQRPAYLLFSDRFGVGLSRLC
jgi:DNA-binding winged helix-turn-helix (wHTH) protein